MVMDQITQYIQTAHDAGCPRDQVERFCSGGYVGLPGMLPFHAAARDADNESGPLELLLDGTRGSAKSHAIIAQVGLDDCQRYAGLKYLFLRKTQKAAAESFDDLVRKVLHGIPHTQNTEKVTFANGSKIVIGGYNNDDDIDKYLGIEYDGLVIEELTQLSGEKVEKLFGSVRTGRQDGWRPRKYLSTNTGGVGHTFVKLRYIQPAREKREIMTRRFFSSYKDNPYIDKAYSDYLNNLTGDLAKSWRDGDWDVFAGQAFSAWRHDRHVCKPFEIPAHWVRVVGIDWGFASPFAVVWMATNPDNQRKYIYRELYLTGLTDRQQARTIKENSKFDIVRRYYADPSMWAKQTAEIITSTADEYAQEGVYLTKADNHRLNGKRKIDRVLSDLPDGKPELMVFESCVNLIRTLPSLPYDTLHVEDVDTTAEDHAYDALKYCLSDDRDMRQTENKPSPWQRMKVL